jgi:hypothetical protein
MTIDEIVIKRDSSIQELLRIESILGSVEVIGFIQGQNDEDRQIFFDHKSDIAICRSKMRRARLEDIASQLDKLENRFQQAIEDIKDEVDRLDNIKDLLRKIDLLVGIISRVLAI